MKAPAGNDSPSAATLHAALLDYYSAPGKYQLTLRQPAILFASIREILQLAAGRGAQAGGAVPGRVREAARFFIRAALLYPGADHYALLGFARGSEPADLKERYRLLMRLIHPDFLQADAPPWPVDAAVRVNKAYEVLSSPTLRREYDEQLAAARPQRAAPVATSRTPSPAPRRREDAMLRAGRRTAWGLAAAAVLLFLFVLFPRHEPEHLVQRKPVPAPGTRPAAMPPAVAQQGAVPPAGSERLRPAAELSSPAPAAPMPSAAPALPGPALPAPAPAPRAAAAPPAAPLVARPVQPAIATPAPPMQAAPALATPPPRPAGADAPARALALPSAPDDLAVPAPAAHIQPVAVASVPPSPTAVTPASATPLAKFAPSPAILAGPSLSDAQPLLTQMLQMLETGSGEQLLRLLDADARQAPGAQALSRQYEQLVKGARPIRLTQVEFRGEPRDGVLLVTGRIRFHAGEPTIGSHGQRMLLRAEFVSRGGKVQLTGLSGAPD